VKITGGNPAFPLRFCGDIPLGRSKDAFERAKGYLLRGQSLPLSDKNGEKKNNFVDILNNIGRFENSQTAVRPDYQRLAKWSQNSRI